MNATATSRIVSGNVSAREPKKKGRLDESSW